jgi:hypothetical protein
MTTAFARVGVGPPAARNGFDYRKRRRRVGELASLQLPEELELLLEAHRLQHRQCRVGRNVRDDSRLRLPVDPAHECFGCSPIAPPGGGEINLDDFATVLFYGNGHPVERRALARLARALGLRRTPSASRGWGIRQGIGRLALPRRVRLSSPTVTRLTLSIRLCPRPVAPFRVDDELWPDEVVGTAEVQTRLPLEVVTPA